VPYASLLAPDPSSWVYKMLFGTAIKPPQLDEFFSIAEAPPWVGEFDNLGWTEEIVSGQ
jgi:hypothetical protein